MPFISGKLIEVYLVVFPIEVSLSAESVSNPKHFFTNSCLDSFGDGFSSSKRGVEAFLAIGWRKKVYSNKVWAKKSTTPIIGH